MSVTEANAEWTAAHEALERDFNHIVDRMVADLAQGRDAPADAQLLKDTFACQSQSSLRMLIALHKREPAR